MTRFALCLAPFFVLGFALAQPLALRAKTMPAAYRAMMQAQYAARTPAPALGAAESARVYGAYLHAIGGHSSHSGADAGISSRPDPDGAKSEP